MQAETRSGRPSARARARAQRLKFTGDNDFQMELRRRVLAHLESTGRRERDCPRMYLKTGVIMASFALVYTLLVFFASAWWQAVPLAIALGLIASAMGFNIMHDAGHKAYSK